MAAETAEDELAESSIHEVLSNDRRRMVIEHLQQSDELTLRELSERIAAQETGESPPPRNIRQSAYVSLQQTHIPKLVGLDIVEYDEREKLVELKRSDKVEVYMEVVPEGEITWSQYYAGLGALGVVATAAPAAGVPGFASVGGVPIATTVFLLVLCSALYQRYRQVRD
ncbi:hypothetical protein SAMN04488063_0627 [Halopelagius inordinatus]|uniref:DUF7344 domain-containing protein n=1 Tax=Halopelagius inordinatus TaxID=553467 RepID=A0A1I2ME29_9EURY|nr:hypothetical protein [Halopelagius inordinatus]SFF87797.1 hypothetical protein SAMN04488063_0627 [Halopelagius inordinatus]